MYKPDRSHKRILELGLNMVFTFDRIPCRPRCLPETYCRLLKAPWPNLSRPDDETCPVIEPFTIRVREVALNIVFWAGVKHRVVESGAVARARGPGGTAWGRSQGKKECFALRHSLLNVARNRGIHWPIGLSCNSVATSVAIGCHESLGCGMDRRASERPGLRDPAFG